MKKLPFKKGDRVRHINDSDSAGTVKYVNIGGGLVDVLWDDHDYVIPCYGPDELVHLPRKKRVK